MPRNAAHHDLDVSGALDPVVVRGKCHDDDERGEEHRDRAEKGAQEAAQTVTNESRGDDDGARCDLAHGDAVNELARGNPLIAIHHFPLDEGNRREAAPESHQVHLREDQVQVGQSRIERAGQEQQTGGCRRGGDPGAGGHRATAFPCLP